MKLDWKIDNNGVHRADTPTFSCMVWSDGSYVYSCGGYIVGCGGEMPVEQAKDRCQEYYNKQTQCKTE